MERKSSDDFLVSLFFQESIELAKALFQSHAFWKCLLIAVPTILVWYYLFWKPFDYFRDFTEFGFQEAQRKPPGNGNNVSRRHIINDMRNRRKLGDHLPPVYPNGWFVILESRDLPGNGTREVSCLGLTLVAWRGTSGKSYVGDAYCPHLGAHLGVGGQVRGECIKCPFHGWSFSGQNGKCVDIPYSDSVPEFARIKIHETVEMNGFIYLWYHAEGEKPHWHPEEIQEITSGEWKYRGRSEFLAACHIQEVPENGSDISHLNVVHKTALLSGGKPTESKMNWGFLTHIWSGGWEPNSDPSQAHKALMTLNHKMSLFNKFHFMEVNVQANQVGPGTVFLRFKGFGGEGVLFFMVTPLEPLLMKISHTFYSSRSMLHPFGLLILLGEAIQLERDIAIWNRKTFISRPLLTKEDKAIKAFRRWFSQFYSEHSPRMSNFSGDSIINPLNCNNNIVQLKSDKLSF